MPTRAEIKELYQKQRQARADDMWEAWKKKWPDGQYRYYRYHSGCGIRWENRPYNSFIADADDPPCKRLVAFSANWHSGSWGGNGKYKSFNSCQTLVTYAQARGASADLINSFLDELLIVKDTQMNYWERTRKERANVTKPSKS